MKPMPSARYKIIEEIFTIICVGFTFSVFKIIFGQFLQATGCPTFAIIFITWGCIDFIINLINLITLSAIRKRVLKICFLNYLVGQILAILPFIKHSGAKDLGTALDVFISFAIVAFMVGGGYLSQLDHFQGSVWQWSVVLNVFYAGFNRLLDSTNRLKLDRSK